MVTSEIFGQGPAGEVVSRVHLRGGGLTARVLTWGATIQDLRLEGHHPSLVLGFETLEDYLAHSPYFGATPGRCANRIAKGRMVLDGTTYELERNERGMTHLHGGSDGIGSRNWQIIDQGEDFVVLQIVDPAGRAGYPGTCTVTCTYRLLPVGVLSVVYETTSDAATVANICQHSYFNLDGESTALGQELQITAETYLPVDGELIPTGELAPVAGTPFDFRTMRRMGRVIDGKPFVYDHNFCLSPERTKRRQIAEARSPVSGISMKVASTEPGLQFYAGGYVDVPVPGLDGKRYGPFSGFCLETQIWPDAINQAGFPNAILRPGEILRQETDYIFSRG